MKIKFDSIGKAVYCVENDPWLAEGFSICTFGPKTTPTFCPHSTLSKPVLIGRELAARMLRQARKNKN